MSVIFKTLAKLKDQSADENEKKRRLKQNRAAYSLRKLVFSSSLLLLSVLVFIVGFVALYGVDYFRGHVNTGRPTPATVVEGAVKNQASEIQNETGASAGTPEPVPDELGDVPTLPENVPAELDDMPLLPEPVVSELSATSPLPGHIRGEKRQPETTGITPGRLIRTTPQQSAEAAGTGQIPNTRNAAAAPIGADTVQTGGAVPTALSRKAPTLFRKGPRDSMTTGKEPAGNSQAGWRSTNPVALPRGGAGPTAPAPLPAREQFSRKAIKKRAGILKLVSRIEHAMGADSTVGPDNDIEALIEQLAAIKGEDQVYVLKVRAYLLLRKKDYGAAAGYLEKVLGQNADDIEAGINMAVIEINQDQVAAARKRLERLRDIYPENVRIPAILAKLGK
ncbi:MAG: tetratricopeptide repeat protein [Desulfobacterales bacterium]|nr:tetratricopeptide repeat protein [Desulfobacterales bacterium]